jgi:hypothetical protein
VGVSPLRLSRETTNKIIWWISEPLFHSGCTGKQRTRYRMGCGRHWLLLKSTYNFFPRWQYVLIWSFVSWMTDRTFGQLATVSTATVCRKFKPEFRSMGQSVDGMTLKLHRQKYLGDFILHYWPELFQGCEKLEKFSLCELANSSTQFRCSNHCTTQTCVGMVILRYVQAHYFKKFSDISRNIYRLT